RGGSVVIVWPNERAWLAARGYRYVSFDADEMAVEFKSPEEAAELTEIFYPRGAEEVRRDGRRRGPYSVLGANPPCDLAYKVIAGGGSRSSPRWCRRSASRSAAARRRSCRTWRVASSAGATTSRSTARPGRRSQASA